MTGRIFDPTDSNETLDALHKFSDEASFDRCQFVCNGASDLRRRTASEEIILRRSSGESRPVIKMPERVGWVVVFLMTR
jgi:hypothetical protein